MRKGIMIDPETGELMIKNGSLLIGSTDEQNMELNIIANKGEFKEFPLLGCEISKEMKGTVTEEFLRKMQISLEMDGYSIKDVAATIIG
jgi:hypothetical protein